MSFSTLSLIITVTCWLPPYRHVARMSDLEPEGLKELMELAAGSTQLLEGCLKAEGFNIGINLGKIAGAGLADHLHVHVVPRWPGDTNFMPVVADTKVISEGLEITYERLRVGLKARPLYFQRTHGEK